MALAYDAAARLSEGRTGLDRLQTLVSACRQRGYTHPELTQRAGQLHDWYDKLDGLDLTALAVDADGLRTAAGEAADALRLSRAQSVELSGGWVGHGAAAAAEFIGRNCDTAEFVVDGLHSSADACAALRDELWRLVDRQVAATVAADRRVGADWADAARAVLAGDAGREGAGEIVDGQVKPFVATVISNEWLAVLRSVADDAAAAYRTAAAAVGARDRVHFEIPGDLGPRYDEPRRDAPSGGAGAVVLPRGASVPVTSVETLAPEDFPVAGTRMFQDALGVPADILASTGPASPGPVGPAAPGPVMAMPPSPVDPLSSGLPSLSPQLPGAMPGFGGGWPGLDSSASPSGGLAELLSGLFKRHGGGPTAGSSPGGVNLPDLGVPKLGDREGKLGEHADPHKDHDNGTDEVEGNAEDGDADAGRPGHEGRDTERRNAESAPASEDPVAQSDPISPPVEPQLPPDEPPVTPEPVPPLAQNAAQPEPLTPPAPQAAQQSPCENAAHELPHVGE
jgi:hypothetical protein